MTFGQFKALDFGAEWRRLTPVQQANIGSAILKQQAAFTVTNDDDPSITREQANAAWDIEHALLNALDELFERNAPNIPWWTPDRAQQAA